MIYRLLLLLVSLVNTQAGTLQLTINHQFEKQALILNSLRYQSDETFSFSRISYLLSEFSLQNADGSWLELKPYFAFLDLEKRRTHFQLPGVPSGNYQALRFSLGVPKKENHGDPARHPIDHPLNPNLNQLHWTWAGSYIFLALEGRYRASDNSLKGFIYHLANDSNLRSIQLNARFSHTENTQLDLAFDLKKLLTSPHPLSFEKEGASTHSHPGDSIANVLVANLPGAFSLLGSRNFSSPKPITPLTPLYLPEKFTPYQFKTSRRFSIPALPTDNPLLTERVALGKQLFFDPLLSQDQSISCASCHQAKRAFSDNHPLSSGVNSRLGTRNAMPLFNLAWKSSFFWDGRATSLREQVLMPIQDHQEMAVNLNEVTQRLKGSAKYRTLFQQAFTPGEITEKKLSLALENYLLSLTSYDSKFDRAMNGKATLTVSEQRGMELFFTEYEPRTRQYGADCFHCHGGANFSDHHFHNNGLLPNRDSGRAEVTQDKAHQNHFSTPSLRNIALTAPYMHDGRFKTLEKVIAHYSGPMHQSSTLDPNLAKHPKQGLQLSTDDQKSLVDFLKTLSDPKFTSSQ